MSDTLTSINTIIRADLACTHAHSIRRLLNSEGVHQFVVAPGNKCELIAIDASGNELALRLSSLLGDEIELNYGLELSLDGAAPKKAAACQEVDQLASSKVMDALHHGSRVDMAALAHIHNELDKAGVSYGYRLRMKAARSGASHPNFLFALEPDYTDELMIIFRSAEDAVSSDTATCTAELVLCTPARPKSRNQ